MLDERTVQEQAAWEHYAKVEAENHHLKKRLSTQSRIISEWQHRYGALNKKYKALVEHRKPRFRNNGKKRVK